MTEIVECVPNFSEGRRQAVADEIAGAARKIAGVRVLGMEMDADHNRSVLTFVGERGPVAEAAFATVEAARRLIDLNHHQGQHKRMGACDVLPFVPVAGCDLDDCAALARSVGNASVASSRSRSTSTSTRPRGPTGGTSPTSARPSSRASAN